MAYSILHTVLLTINSNKAKEEKRNKKKYWITFVVAVEVEFIIIFLLFSVDPSIL